MEQVGRTDVDVPAGAAEQKFKILLSAAGEADEFERLVKMMSVDKLPIAILFFDIDHFKKFNTDFTETVVDQTLLPEFQRLVRRLSKSRGGAYRHGGEEVVVILPNHTLAEGIAFGERLRGRPRHTNS